MAIPGVNSASPVTDLAPAPAALRWQSAAIVAIEQRTPRLSSFFLAPALPFGFVAGQHVDVRLTAPDGYQAQRSYSIASAPESGTPIELAVERLEDGEVSAYFHDVAAVGDTIELRGPIGGHFVWSVAEGGPLMLIGGGSGVVPLMAMLRHRAAHGSTVPALLLFSARSWQEVVFRDELMRLAQQDDGFKLALALTREDAPPPGVYARRVDTLMLAECLARLPAPPRHVFVCGANPFVEAATQSAIAAGVPATRIRTERYGG